MKLLDLIGILKPDSKSIEDHSHFHRASKTNHLIWIGSPESCDLLI